MFLVVQKTRIIENTYLFLPVLCKCMVEEREPSKRFSSLDFIYLQSPSIYCSSNMAPIAVNMEINAYFISIWAVANTRPFSELQWVGLYWCLSELPLLHPVMLLRKWRCSVDTQSLALRRWVLAVSKVEFTASHSVTCLQNMPDSSGGIIIRLSFGWQLAPLAIFYMSKGGRGGC